MIVGGGGGGGSRPRPKKKSRPRSGGIAAAASAGVQAAAPAPKSYVTPNSSGQYSAPSPPRSYSGGGGAPRNPSPPRQGPIQGPGRGGGGPKPKPRPKPKPKPKPPSIAKFLAGDDVYQDQISQLMKQLENFLTANKSQRGDIREDFNTSLSKMDKQKAMDLEAMENDFAARGLLTSGLYTDSVGDYNKQYQTQLDDLTTSRQRSIGDLIESMKNYRTENQGQRKNARADAIRRRAEKFGIRR